VTVAVKRPSEEKNNRGGKFGFGFSYSDQPAPTCAVVSLLENAVANPVAGCGG